MTAHRRAHLGLVLGVLSAIWPALIWGFIVATELRDPKAFHDQGGMFITLILFPLSLLGAVACGVPAAILAVVPPSPPGDESGPRWRFVGAALSILGLGLAVGTCIGPQVLAEAVR